MRFIKTHPSKKDKDSKVFEFWIGKPELLNLYEIVAHYSKSIPVSIDTIPIRGRIRSMKNTIVKALKKEYPNIFVYRKRNKSIKKIKEIKDKRNI